MVQYAQQLRHQFHTNEFLSAVPVLEKVGDRTTGYLIRWELITNHIGKLHICLHLACETLPSKVVRLRGTTGATLRTTKWRSKYLPHQRHLQGVMKEKDRHRHCINNVRVSGLPIYYHSWGQWSHYLLGSMMPCKLYEGYPSLSDTIRNATSDLVSPYAYPSTVVQQPMLCIHFTH